MGRGSDTQLAHGGRFSSVVGFPVSLLPPGSEEGDAAKKPHASNPQRVRSPVGLVHISIIESSPKDFCWELE